MASLLRGAAFITGAGSGESYYSFLPCTCFDSIQGIGQYTAYALARHGVRQLAICDIRPDVLKNTSNELQKQHNDIEVLSIEMDTSKEDSVRSAIDQTVKKFGRLDIAINNAGIGGTQKQTPDQELSDWQRVMDVNVNGVWLCQRAQIRQMLKQEPLDPPPRGNRGVIVNTASMLGLVASSPVSQACSYTASKHGKPSGTRSPGIELANLYCCSIAVMGLTKTDAITYASQGIRINAVCPGYVGTPLLKQAAVCLGKRAFD